MGTDGLAEAADERKPMIRPIMRSELFLSRPSLEATEADLEVGRDLLDTLRAHRHECVGMAANMIGVSKRVIAFDDEGTLRAMFNPEIVSKAGEYRTEEGCLSLAGQRPVVRYKTVKVRYRDERWKERCATYSGWSAQIIQHEVDHCDGIVV